MRCSRPWTIWVTAPNFLAQSLANKSSNSIGLVVSNFDGPYFGRLLRRAAKLIEASGKHLIVTDGPRHAGR
jgi:DNA-binding LacI/PurR family transcriptional regulator